MAKKSAIPATDEDWRVEEACNTLLRASEMSADAKLMAKARKKLAQKAKNMKNVGRMFMQQK